MDYTDSPEVAQFRAALRTWLAENRELYTTGDGSLESVRRWYRALADGGYVGLSLPAEYGGGGRPDAFEAVLNDELARADAPPSAPIGHIAHALADHGAPELARRLLPGLLGCTEYWCQGFSEPGAGSDLAGITSHATPSDDGTFRLTGHKIWTSGATSARWCLLLARTEMAESRHRGLSMLVVDMQSEGIECREVVMSTGSREFAEVFFTDVTVPAENLVGSRGQGWQIAMDLLTYERGPADMGWVGRISRVLAAMQADVAAGRVQADLGQRRRLAASWVNVQVMQWHVQRSLAAREHTRPGAEGSIDKLLATRVEQDVYRVITDLAGGSASYADPRRFAEYLYSRAQSIYGGTQQIQRTIVAQRLLKLPR